MFIYICANECYNTYGGYEMQLKKKKLTKIGNSYGFTVPMAFVTNGQIDTEKLYDLDIKEASKKKVRV